MRNILSLTCLLLLMLPCRLFSQEYSYTHYDIADGLAGSTVYCITQDKDGFIWAGTEAGVSRFDGTHFRNFTTVDGLPDVEVLEMFADSRGRVWMAPFRKSLCYFYKGKICNQENDPLLHNIRLRNTIHGFAEDRAGDVLAATRTALFLIKPDGRVREIDSLNGRPLQNCGAIATGNDGNFLVQSANEVYRLSGEKFTPLYAISIQDSWPFYISMNSAGMIWRRDSVSAAVHSFSTGKTVYLPFERVHYRHNTFTSLGDSLFCFNENNGVNEYNLFTGQFRRMLPGKQVSRSFRDAAGNTWFTTIGQGIYRLNSDEFRSIRLSTPHSVSSSIQAIRRIGDMLLVGGDLNYIFVFRFPAMSLNKTVAFSGGIKNRITYFGTASNGNVYVVTDGGIRWLSRDFRTFGAAFTGAKACLPFGSGKLLIATYWGVGIFDLHSFKILDTIFRERTTALYYHRDTILVGTLEGLYGIAPDRSVHFLGKSIPFLRRRISALTESADGTLWVASYDAGIIGYKDGAVIARFGKQQGLSSDICRTVLIHNNALWVGTDKGLTKVSLNRPGYPMEHYTSQDGLGSDIINTIYADGPVIYVGTPVGFSMFDETRIDVSESCRLYLLSIQNGDRERIGDSASLLLPYMDKHLRLEFAGISYRSVGDITYQYRLVGLDSAWRTTRESFLEYPTLPSGKYQLQLQAVNKFGVQSNIVTLPFEVETPWWQTTLFYILQVAVFLSITWLGVSLRIRQIRNRQREKEKLNQRMMKMEHMALQAQMNPHFIFNCLNSIQQYIFDQDIFAANKYITGFSRLIRSTLQNSSKSFIPLADEISYLSNYLSLEKLRFKEKMDYSIGVSPDIDIHSALIPPMLIQPYVENSMRHGLRHKTDGKGLIRITICMSAGDLTVMIEDNGIGRERASLYKTAEHIEYQSKGMTLTAERIGLMNKLYGEGIRVEIFDLRDEKEAPGGTKVIIKFPLFAITSKNDLYDPDYTD